MKKLTEMDVKLGGTKLKLAEAESLKLAQADEIANLKAAIEACEEKWYNEGFVDAENSVEPIVHQAQHHGLGEGWLAALQALGVAEDSPLRNPEQIPYLTLGMAIFARPADARPDPNGPGFTRSD